MTKVVRVSRRVCGPWRIARVSYIHLTWCSIHLTESHWKSALSMSSKALTNLIIYSFTSFFDSCHHRTENTMSYLSKELKFPNGYPDALTTVRREMKHR